jgi:nucleotide-binding universal stress UspA family protein
MFDTILLATDGSADAQEALNYAAKLALRDEAEVIVVNAFEPVPSYLGEPMRDDLVERHVNRARDLAQRHRSRLNLVPMLLPKPRCAVEVLTEPMDASRETPEGRMAG